MYVDEPVIAQTRANIHDNISLTKIIPSSSKYIKIGFTDIDGIMRGKYISQEKFNSSIENGIGFCDVIMGWDINDQLYDNVTFTGWHTAFPDLQLRIIKESHRKIPFINQTSFYITELLQEASSICPRNILRTVTEKCHKMGFKCYTGFEYEFAIFNDLPRESNTRKNESHILQPLYSGSYAYSVRKLCEIEKFCQQTLSLSDEMIFPLEGLHTEAGQGILEAALKKSEGIEAADRAILFKTFIKILAKQLGYVVSFMAKIFSDLPGQGGHFHLSLQDHNNNPVFYDSTQPLNMSRIMSSFVAGQLALMPDLFLLYAPTINSYKRFVPGVWAPIKVDWGIENRTKAIRIINNDPNSQRIECRTPGADANPYLALAATLASGLWGIENNLQLKEIDQFSATFPRSLSEAIGKLRNSPIARQLFGKTFIEHYCQTREWEERQFLYAVTEWERKRYLELV